MKLPKLAIDNYQFTLVMATMLVILGVVGFLTMPRSEDPQVAPSGSSVIVIYPGAGPEDLETLVVDPVEEAINELEAIKKFNSRVSDGLAVVNVEFESGSDPDEKYSDVLQKVNKVRNRLPKEILSMEIIKWSIANVNIIQIALISDSASYSHLELQADELKNRLEKINGIKKVDTWAHPEQIIDVAIDFEKMAHMKIPLNQVFGAIQSSNSNIPGGSVDVGSRKFNVRTSGFYEDLDDIKNTIISARMAQPVRLRDIADITFSYEDNNYYARYNGKKSVFVTAKQKKGTNIFSIMEDIHGVVDEFSGEIPKSIELEYVFDQSDSVAKRLNVFFISLLQGMLLVGFVVFIVFGFRTSLVIAIAIPVSILIGIGFVDLSGYGLEQMSIAALVIALGLLVDNAIVITENISRFIAMGSTPKEAAVAGTSQVAWAVVSSTVTTVLAFVPMIMMQNITGDFIRSMPVTVVYTLTASLLVALTLTPLFTRKFLHTGIPQKEGKVKQKINHLIETHYRKTLDFALTHKSRVISIALFVFIGSLGLFPVVGVSFFPKAEKPQMMINIETPQGTSLSFTDSIATRIESDLAKIKEIKHFAVNIGRSNPQLYYNVIEKRRRSNYAEIFIQMKNEDQQTMQKVIAQLRHKYENHVNARIEVKEFEQGPPVEAPVAIKIIGKNLDQLKAISRDVEAIFRSEPGVLNINNPLATAATDLHVKINRIKAGMLGIPLVDIDRTVRTALTGINISTFRDENGEEYDISLRLPMENRPQKQDFNRIYLSSILGDPIPLSHLAAIEFKESPTIITHYKMERNATVKSDVRADFSVDKVTRNIISKLEAYDWPNGYRFEVGGEMESREESFGGLGKAVIIAILAIFGVLVLQFKSFRQPVIVFMAIPLAIIGSVIALLITGYSFSFTAFVGITSLVGIVINNSIILVDYTNQLRIQGKNIRAAIKEAGETRFMPIILTTATTVGGLLPLTLGGGSLWAPMGWTIIGGLLVSTFLTLIVVPVFYELLSKD